MSMARWQLIFLVLATVFAVSSASDALQEQKLTPSRISSAASPAGSLVVRHMAVKAAAPAARRLGHHNDSSKSAAAGGIAIGGLGAAMIVVVVCYVRVTRREASDNV